MRKIDSIIIHCSATRAGLDFTAADIDRWHRERGFNGIGYHYVIRLGDWRRDGIFLCSALIAGDGTNGASGYVISADWTGMGSLRIPGRTLRKGCFIR